MGTGLAYGRVKQPDPLMPDYNPYDPTWAAYGTSEQPQFKSDYAAQALIDRGSYDPS